MDVYTFIVTIQYLALAILFVELVYALLKQPSQMQLHVILLAIAAIIMIVGYMIEMRSENLEEGMLAAAMSYIGKPYVMGASFIFLCSVYGKRIPKWAIATIYCYCAFFPVIVFTNRYHYLYYSTVTYDITQKYSPMVMTHGPFYTLYIVTAVVYFFACLFVIFTGYKKLKYKDKHEIALWTGLMVTSGITGYAVYLLDLTNGYDSTMIGIFFGIVFLFIVFLRFKIFDALAVAKDYALGDSSIGLIVFDERDNLIYNNIAAGAVLDKGLEEEYLKSLSNNKPVTYTSEGKVYRLLKKELNNEGVFFGHSIEINDITYSYNYQTRLEHDVKERTEKLETLQRSLIASVANLIEARSLETGEHIQRTSSYVGMIAAKLRQMGKYTDVLTDDYVELLVSATPLHDVGKISITDLILLKPGKLTADEFEIMKTHAPLGAEVIETTLRGLETPEYIDLAKDIAAYHHEWWDGTGYTKQLKGFEIPLSARIVAVADCFDAISSKRCYKDALSFEETVKIIKSESGTHFEPALVDAFVSALDDLGVKTY